MVLRLNRDLRDETPAAAEGPDGLVVLLPESAGGDWRWWRVSDAALGGEHGFAPGDDAPWGELGEGRVVALVPAALAPVRSMPRGEMPMAQALAAARLDPPGLSAPGNDSHVAVAAGADGETVLSATVAKAEMDLWLAQLAANGLDAAALVPAALVLPLPAADRVSTGTLGDQALARTGQIAFAGEGELVALLAPGGEVEAIDGDALARRLVTTFEAPELDLRQGAYAIPRVSYFRLPDWRQLARMAAILALLVFAIFAIETLKLNFDASQREDAALEMARAHYPGVGDLAAAEVQIRTELLRRGAGGVTFADSAPAVFAAMQPVPSVSLRNLNWRADGTLAIRAAAPSSDALNRMLIALQRDGWQITVPPEIAPDPTGATVADITVRAP